MRNYLLAAVALLLGCVVLFNRPQAHARTSLPGTVLDYNNGTLTGSASIMTSAYTATWNGVVRIQFSNDSGGSASTPQVLINGATFDLGTSSVAAGDQAAFVLLIADGDSLNFTVDTTTTGCFKVFDLGEGQ